MLIYVVIAIIAAYVRNLKMVLGATFILKSFYLLVFINFGWIEPVSIKGAVAGYIIAFLIASGIHWCFHKRSTKNNDNGAAGVVGSMAKLVMRIIGILILFIVMSTTYFFYKGYQEGKRIVEEAYQQPSIEKQL